MGFGRIIAAAGSSRPRATTESLTTWSLRPPFPTWMSGPGATGEASGAAPSSWTTRAVPSSSRRPAPTRPTAPARPAAPPKVDALRRLLESQGMIPAAPAAESGSPAAARSGESVVSSTTDSPLAPDRTATSAGPTTAPGQLGRRARPEAVPTEERLATVFPERPAEPRPVRRAAAAPASIDRFRSALESRGLVPSTVRAATIRRADAARHPRPNARPDGAVHRTAARHDNRTRRPDLAVTGLATTENARRPIRSRPVMRPVVRRPPICRLRSPNEARHCRSACSPKPRRRSGDIP